MAIRRNDTGPLVRKWQQFLVRQGFLTAEPNGTFGPRTEEATRAFQRFYQISSTGVAGTLTFGKAYELGFNPDNEPVPPQLRTETDIMQWIKDNLGANIRQAITGSIYTEDWLAGICARETGFLIMRKFNEGFTYNDICLAMKGDYGRRSGEPEARYHGFGFWQIDVGSFPEFTNSEDWKDPQKTAQKAVSVLNGKRAYLIQKGWNTQLSATQFERAITAAYNCGEGNVNKALERGLDIDTYTYTHDYSSEVFRYRRVYQSL